MNENTDINSPHWVTDKGKIDEPAFCEYFADEYGLACMNGMFYNYMGAVEEKVLRTVIYETISPYVKNRVSNTVNSIMESLKLHCYKEPCRPETSRIHVNNGVITIDGEIGRPPTFSTDIEYCRNRLNINYNPDIWKDTYYPEKFLLFIYL